MRDPINRFENVSDLVYHPRIDQQVDTNFKLQAYAIILLRGYGQPWVLFSFLDLPYFRNAEPDIAHSLFYASHPYKLILTLFKHTDAFSTVIYILTRKVTTPPSPLVSNG